MKSNEALTERGAATPALTPISRRTLTDDVLANLRQGIIEGAFGPGCRIVERKLAEQLGVSRGPVREAMLRLEHEGLLVCDKGRGAIVKDFDKDDFDEIVTARSMLETTAARLACRKLEPADVARFDANMEQMRASSELLEVTHLDIAFHDLIAQTARHSRLYGFWSMLRPQLELWLARMHRRFEARLGHTREMTVQAHAKIVEVLRSQDEQASAVLLEQQIHVWGQHQLDLFQDADT